MTPNPYKTLNVPKDATLATIRSAHRKLVLLCHPDKVQDETAKKIKGEQFHLVQQAYEILSDETRRRRYDARVKLAELREERADMMDDRAPPRRSNEYSPKTTHSPAFAEMRNGREYVEVKPRTARYEDEGDVFSQRFAGERVRRFEERNYDDRYGEPPPRKSSGRGPDEKKKYRDREADEIERERNERRSREAKAQQESLLRDQARRRDKDTKRDRETKSSEKFYPAWTTEFDPESDVDRYPGSGRGDQKAKRNAEHSRRGSREEPPRRGSKAKDYDETNSLDEKLNDTYRYISKSREAMDAEPIRPRRSRTGSVVDRTPPPPPPAPRPSDGGRKSSRRSPHERTSSPPKKSNKDKRVAEIVDPPSSRKPSMPTTKSDQKGLKGLFSSSRKEQDPRKEPQRASTAYQPSPETKHSSPEIRKPAMRRAETMPINQSRRADAAPSTPSHLRKSKAPPSDSSDVSSDTSDSDSDATPEILPPRQTKYKVSKDAAERPRIIPVVAEPEDYRSSREPSPKTARRSTERPPPARSSTTWTPPTTKRSTSYATPDDKPSPRGKLHRADTERPTPPKHKPNGASLFGAIDSDDPRSPRAYPMDEMRQPRPYSQSQRV